MHGPSRIFVWLSPGFFSDACVGTPVVLDSQGKRATEIKNSSASGDAQIIFVPSAGTALARDDNPRGVPCVASNRSSKWGSESFLSRLHLCQGIGHHGGSRCLCRPTRRLLVIEQGERFYPSSVWSIKRPPSEPGPPTFRLAFFVSGRRFCRRRILFCFRLRALNVWLRVVNTYEDADFKMAAAGCAVVRRLSNR